MGDNAFDRIMRLRDESNVEHGDVIAIEVMTAVLIGFTEMLDALCEYDPWKANEIANRTRASVDLAVVIANG